MNEQATEGTLIIADVSRARREGPAEKPVEVSQPTPMGMLDVAVRRGAGIEELSKLMDLQDRWERNEARKAFVVAFSQFKSEAIIVLKNKDVTDGPLRGKSYAELHSVVNAVTPALSKYGLGASWKLTKDEKDWLEVTCTLTHSLGHSESVSMGGPPDTGGAKSPIQARASTISYLERYTLKAVCGVAEQGEDDDCNGGRKEPEVKKEPEKPAATDEQIAAQLTAWGKLVDSGKQTADSIIVKLRTKVTVTPEQEETIRKALA